MSRHNWDGGFKPDWTPVRRGAIYCSPACGYDCTFEAYERAHQLAAELAARLGPGWTTDVWENGAWHYCARSPNGCVKVSPIKSGGAWHGYHAFIGSAAHTGGTFASERCDTPEEAVAIARKMAQRAVDDMTAWLSDAPPAEGALTP